MDLRGTDGWRPQPGTLSPADGPGGPGDTDPRTDPRAGDPPWSDPGGAGGGSGPRGVDRRSLLRWSAFMAGVLALPAVPYAAVIAEAVTTKPRLPVLWLSGQDCTGELESLLRSAATTPTGLLLDVLSMEYAELLMAPSGTAAEKSRTDAVSAYKGKYVVVVEGSVPGAADGTFCTVGGRAFTDVLRATLPSALAVVAVGTCACYGGLPAAAGGVTGATTVRSVLGSSSVPLILLPGCPANADNLAATFVNYLALGSWPARDSSGRPTFAYGSSIHSRCERRRFYEAEQFVRAWGDAGARAGWCLKQMGCRGPSARANCPTVKFNGATSWPVGAGAVCLGCTSSGFWDSTSDGDDDGGED